MGKRWTTDIEFDWLDKKVEDYLKARSKGSTFKSNFLLLTRKAWMDEFPERSKLFPLKSDNDVLSPEEEKALVNAKKKRHSQIDSWFDWRTRKITRTAVPKDDASALLSLIDSEAAKNADRAPQKGEIYLRLFPDKVKAIYDSESHPEVTNPGVRLNKLKAIAQELLARDNEDVKKQVDDEVAKWKKEKAESVKNLRVDDTKPLPTPEEYQSALKRLPLFLAQIMEPLVRATGWSFLVLCGGPVPDQGGRPFTNHHHFGPKNAEGQDFSESYGDFGRLVMHPYSLYILDICMKALQNEQSQHDANATDACSIPNADSDDHPTTLGDNASASQSRSEVTDAANGEPSASSDGPAGAGSPAAADIPSTFPPTSATHPLEPSDWSSHDIDHSDSEDEDPLASVGTFSFSANRQIYNSTTESDKPAEHVEQATTVPELIQQDLSTPAIDPALGLATIPHGDAMDSMNTETSIRQLEQEVCLPPSQTLHPGGPTEPLSRAMLRDSIQIAGSPTILPMTTSSVDTADQVVNPSVDLDRLGTTITPTASLLLDSAVENFVYNPVLSQNTTLDYTVQGAQLNLGSDRSVTGAEADKSGPATVTRTKKRSRPQNIGPDETASSTSARTSSRVRKSAKFGPSVVSDPNAPQKRVKHSWFYADD